MLNSIFSSCINLIWFNKNRLTDSFLVISKIKPDLCLFLLKNITFLKYDILNDIVVIDWVIVNRRFEVIYSLFSYLYLHRLHVSCFLRENQGIRSLNKVFRNSVWFEREAWDMFGVFFFHNPDLRRILTDYGFEGFPLRKDFPLTGYLEVRFDDETASLVYEPVELAQEYRFFTFISPWENVDV